MLHLIWPRWVQSRDLIERCKFFIETSRQLKVQISRFFLITTPTGCRFFVNLKSIARLCFWHGDVQRRWDHLDTSKFPGTMKVELSVGAKRFSQLRSIIRKRRDATLKLSTPSTNRNEAVKWRITICTDHDCFGGPWRRRWRETRDEYKTKEDTRLRVSLRPTLPSDNSHRELSWKMVSLQVSVSFSLHYHLHRSRNLIVIYFCSYC